MRVWRAQVIIDAEVREVIKDRLMCTHQVDLTGRPANVTLRQYKLATFIAFCLSSWVAIRLINKAKGLQNSKLLQCTPIM